MFDAHAILPRGTARHKRNVARLRLLDLVEGLAGATTDDWHRTEIRVGEDVVAAHRDVDALG